MRKKCVRWTKSVRAVVIGAVAITSAMIAAPSAQSGDPTTQPRLAATSLTYMGGFRLPSTSANGDSFSFGGRQLTYNPISNSLFVGSRIGRVAEVNIPGYVNSSDPAAMPQSTYLQSFTDPTEGHLAELGTDGPALDGLLVYNNTLYGTASVYYDALNQQRVSHYSHSLQLNEPSFSGFRSVWDPAKTGFVSGAMSLIPGEWQALLGGPAATGQCCIPIVTRTSFGPAAFAFDPAQIGPATAPAVPLLYYPADHTTLGAWDAQNETYGSTTMMGGMAIIAGTRTALYLGRNGMGPNCYGNGTSDQSLVGTIAPDGAHYCYDPTSNDKGSHAYPYRYQIWAYDLNDFAAVKAGTKQPWEVTPYGVWPLELPTLEPSMHLGGVGYDPVRQLLYVSQMYADKDGYAYRPIVHVLQINAAPGTIDSSSTPPPTTTAPPPPTDASTSTLVNAITLSANHVAPQVSGTAITFTVFATGTGATQEYKWLVDDGNGFKAVANWSAADTYAWTPTAANANYRVAVWARGTGNAADAAEASASTRFAIDAPAPEPVRSVTFSSDKPAPQAPGASITFTATVDGGRAVEYKWLVHDGLAWGAVTGWSANNTFAWTPAAANTSARVGIWVRSNGNTKDEPESTFSSDFPITSAAATAPAGPVSSVTFSSDKAAPQPQGTTIAFTAAADGGSAVEYKWLVHDGLAWSAVTGWSAQNTFAWTPASANASARVGIWVRSNGSTADQPEATWSADFPITAPPPPPIAGVTLTTDRPAPQLAGTTIVATATVSGGSAAIQYRWLIHDGYTWNTVTDWTTSSTYNWTPAVANSGHFIGVWVRNAANTSGDAEATMSLPYPIK